MKSLTIFALSLIIIINLSCSRSVELVNYLPINDSINIRIKEKYNLHSKSYLNQKSEKYLSLKQWLSENIDNWKPTPVTYAAVLMDVFIQYDDFTFFYSKNGNFVVINYKDENNKFHQITKVIKEGELDFLLK